MERITGVEPVNLAWKARVLPLNYIRIMVRVDGIEPSRCYHRGILSPLHLPILLHPHGGQGGIRTHGRFHADSFQDCCHRPLDHLSVMAVLAGFEPADAYSRIGNLAGYCLKPLDHNTMIRL